MVKYLPLIRYYAVSLASGALFGLLFLITLEFRFTFNDITIILLDTIVFILPIVSSQLIIKNLSNKVQFSTLAKFGFASSFFTISIIASYFYFSQLGQLKSPLSYVIIFSICYLISRLSAYFLAKTWQQNLKSQLLDDDLD
ncbi:MAG: hypothetical protein ACPGLV_10555 [Bacteroidia bacterium]